MRYWDAVTGEELRRLARFKGLVECRASLYIGPGVTSCRPGREPGGAFVVLLSAYGKRFESA